MLSVPRYILLRHYKHIEQKQFDFDLTNNNQYFTRLTSPDPTVSTQALQRAIQAALDKIAPMTKSNCPKTPERAHN
jgi:hypothetical protein